MIRKIQKQNKLRFHGFPVLDEQGDLAQMIEYSFDITEKKNWKIN